MLTNNQPALQEDSQLSDIDNSLMKLNKNAGTKIEIVKSAAADFAKDATAVDSFEQLLDECDAFSGNRSLFAEANKTLFPGVEKANAVYSAIKSDSAKHLRVIDRLVEQRNCQRSPSPKKPAYNAVCYTCCPQSPEEWSLCSDWANVLLLADIEKVQAADFSTWLMSQKVGAAKRKVRDLKKGKCGVEPIKKLKLPFDESEFPTLIKAVREKDSTLLSLMKEELIKTEKTLTSVRSVTV